MHIGTEGRLFSTSSTIMSADDEAPLGGGGSAEPAAPSAPEPVSDGAPVDAAPMDDAPVEDAPVDAAPVEEEQQQIDPALMPEIQRLLAGQMQQEPPPVPGFDPNTLRSAFAPILDPVVQQNQALMNIIQSAAAQQKQAQLEATRPVPPPPDAPASEHLKFIHDNLKWEQQQASKGVEGKIDQILKTFEQQQQAQQRAMQQQQQTMQRQRLDQAYTVGISQLARAADKPHMKVFANPDAAAALRAIHERIPNMSLPQVADLMLQAFGVGPKTAAASAATRRAGEQVALTQRRQQVRQGGKPMPAGGNSGKAGSPPKGAREAAIAAMQRGARLDPTLLRSLNIDPTKPN